MLLVMESILVVPIDVTRVLYVVYIILLYTSASHADICHQVDEAAELSTPFVHGGDYMHPAKMYISNIYFWASRTQFCNDDSIQPTSCSNISCSVSQCVSVVIPETTYLYTAYHEETCNTDLSNDILCEAIGTHFNGTEWYRQDVARHCVEVAGDDLQ